MNQDKFYQTYPDCRAFEILDKLVSILLQLKVPGVDKKQVISQCHTVCEYKEIDLFFALMCIKSQQKYVSLENKIKEYGTVSQFCEYFVGIACFKSLSLTGAKLKLSAKTAQEFAKIVQNNFEAKEIIVWLQDLQKMTQIQRFCCSTLQSDTGSKVSGDEISLTTTTDIQSGKTVPELKFPEIAQPEELNSILATTEDKKNNSEVKEEVPRRSKANQNKKTAKSSNSTSNEPSENIVKNSDSDSTKSGIQDENPVDAKTKDETELVAETQIEGESENNSSMFGRIFKKIFDK